MHSQNDTWNRNVIKNGKMSNERAIDTPADLSQPQVDDMSLKHISTREVYVHLMNTAYELALNVSRAVWNDDDSSAEQQSSIHFR